MTEPVHFGILAAGETGMVPWCSARSGPTTILAKRITCPACRDGKNLPPLPAETTPPEPR